MFHFKSPAKLNLFLHVLDKRVDGYYNIQSVFQLIDLFDYIRFEKTTDNKIVLTSNIKQLEQDNLIINTINLFKFNYSFLKNQIYFFA